MKSRPDRPLAITDYNAAISRRHFFRRSATGLGIAALGSLLDTSWSYASADAGRETPAMAQIPAKARHVIYISLIGAPSQADLFDYKPLLKKRYNEDIKDWLLAQGERLTGMTSGQVTFPLAPTIFEFKQHGRCGTWVSELLPWHGKMADDLCVIRSMHTDAINHEPANQLFHTGSMITGKASLGSWLAYGLGSLNRDLPEFVVLHASHSNERANVQAISARLWGAGCLPGKYAGVTLRSSGDPVLFLKDAPGIPRELRWQMIENLKLFNERSFKNMGDPETRTRTEEYEMAFRMQAGVPELTDLSGESAATRALYGPEASRRGTFANSALLARRLVERGVRFVQIFHRGWDQHVNLPADLAAQCKDIDQGSYGLIQDLKQRGLLEDTLVVWGGEFGRTIYCQGSLSESDYGRDHHPRCFTMWLAGGGVRGGTVHGATDEMSYNVVEKGVHIHALHATILHQLGLDHKRLSFRFQGLDQRLTGVEPVEIVKEILA